MHLSQRAQRNAGIGLLGVAMTAVSLGAALVVLPPADAHITSKVLCLSFLPALSLATTSAISQQLHKVSRK